MLIQLILGYQNMLCQASWVNGESTVTSTMCKRLPGASHSTHILSFNSHIMRCNVFNKRILQIGNYGSVKLNVVLDDKTNE